MTTSNDPLDRLPRWVPAVTYALLTVIAFRAYFFAPPGSMLYGSDTIAAGVLFRSFFVSAFRAVGHIPQWNPYLFGGLPYLEAGGGDTMYPSAVLHFMMSMPAALAWKLILHVFVAGFSMYYCVRAFGGSRWVAYVAGGAHLLSAQMISQVNNGQDTKLYVTAIFPLTLGLLVRAIDRKSFPHFVWAGLLAGFLLLGHPILSFYAWMTLGIFGLAMVWMRRSEGAKATLQRLGGGAVTLATALGIASILLIPMYQYLRNYSPRSGEGKGYEYAASYPLNIPETAGLLVGRYSGSDAMTAAYWGPNPLKGNLEYGGTLVFVLGLAAVFALKGDRRRWGLGAMMLVTWIYALGDRTPLFKLVFTLLKPTRSFRAPSLVMFLFFTAALLLTALLLDRVVRPGPEGDEVRKRTGWGLAVGGAVALLLTLLAQVGGPAGVFSVFGPGTASGGQEQGINAARLQSIATNLDAMVIAGWIAVICCAVMWFMVRGVGKGSTPAWALLIGFLGLTSVDLLYADAPFVQAVPYAQFFPDDPSFQALKQQLGPGERVLPSDAIVEQGKLATYGIPEVFGYHGNQLRWYDVITRRHDRDEAEAIMQQARDIRPYNAYFLQLMTSGLGRALGIRLAIIPATDVPITGWTKLAGDQNTAIYRSNVSLPGGAIVPQVAVEPDTMKIVDALWDPAFDPAKLAMVGAPVASLGAGGGKGTFAYVGESSDTVALDVTTDAPALFLLTRNWHPYWQVEIDGQRGETVRTDYAFLGAVLPTAGKHRVIFRYRSPMIARAELISGTSWAFVLGVTLWTLVGWYRRRNAGG